uniref:Uncharacterized protein n=1 Tax=Panagrolaimus sp. PS1159 TaxID=55785 RepID=A0AC35FE90_9BILA
MVEQTVSDRMIDSGIKMESRDGSPLNEQLLANGNGSLASPNSGNENTFDPILESQRTFQRLLGGFNLRQAFQMNPSLFAAIQQQQLLNFNNNNNLLSSPSSSRQTPDRQDDEDNYEDVENLNDGEPEDLSLGFRKEKKQSLSEGDDSGSGSANTSWSFEEQFKQVSLPYFILQ